ncbi:MAG: flagellar protein FliT [Burkholderiaceae bacterium]
MDTRSETAVPPPLIDYYRSLEQACRRMLASARAARWAEVDACRQICVPMIAQLKRAARSASLGHDEELERLRLMRRIVQMEGEVRRLASPADDWLARMFVRRPTADVMRESPRRLD